MYGCWYSIRKCAEIVEITVPTSFAWRHKILDALRLYIGTGHVSGLVEADETFFRLSYKGNHSKSSGFTMPRKPNLRGPKSKKQKMKNLNQEVYQEIKLL